MRKWTVVFIALLFIMGISVGAYADEKKDGAMAAHKSAYGNECGGEHSHMFMFKKLGLDDKQKEAIRAIHLKTKKEMIQKVADIKLAKIELMEILSKDPVDMAAAEAAVKKIAGLRAEMKMMHIRAMEEIKSNLNVEQKKKFNSMSMHFLMHRGHNRCGCHGHHMGKGMKRKGDMQHGDK